MITHTHIFFFHYVDKWLANIEKGIKQPETI